MVMIVDSSTLIAMIDEMIIKKEDIGCYVSMIEYANMEGFIPITEMVYRKEKSKKVLLRLEDFESSQLSSQVQKRIHSKIKRRH